MVMKICGECMTELPNQARFCGACGTEQPISGGPTVAPSTSTRPTEGAGRPERATEVEARYPDPGSGSHLWLSLSLSLGAALAWQLLARLGASIGSESQADVVFLLEPTGAEVHDVYLVDGIDAASEEPAREQRILGAGLLFLRRLFG